MSDLSIKVVPKSRDQRRELDKAAKAAGLKTGPWVLSVALAAARVAAPVSKPIPGPSNAVWTPTDQSGADDPLWVVRLRDTRDGSEHRIERRASTDAEAQRLTLLSLGEDAVFYAVLTVMPAP